MSKRNVGMLSQFSQIDSCGPYPMLISLDGASKVPPEVSNMITNLLKFDKKSLKSLSRVSTTWRGSCYPPSLWYCQCLFHRRRFRWAPTSYSIKYCSTKRHSRAEAVFWPRLFASQLTHSPGHVNLSPSLGRARFMLSHRAIVSLPCAEGQHK